MWSVTKDCTAIVIVCSSGFATSEHFSVGRAIKALPSVVISGWRVFTDSAFVLLLPASALTWRDD